MSVGQFVFMLHSHLPYYRKAGMWPFGEENLYECMAETYVPLLNAIAELYEEGIKAKLTVGITPILAEQLNDEQLNAKQPNDRLSSQTTRSQTQIFKIFVKFYNKFVDIFS